jgi:N-acetylmuramoyl-L-alanine amidase-like protein
VIGQDGAIVQCVHEHDAAWANGAITGLSGTSGDGNGNGHHDSWWDNGPNPNLLCITIEHVKPHEDNSDHLTEAQKQASFELVSHICQRWDIPARKADAHGGITGHYSVDPVNRARCPGPYPWDELFTYLDGEHMQINLNTPGISAFFSQAQGDAWHCTRPGHNFVIGGAILAFYRSFGGNGLCGLTHLGLPLSNEVGFGDKRVFQRFERGVLCYDPQRTNDRPPGASGTVYLMHIDGGPGQDPRVAALQTQVAQLQQRLAHATQTPHDPPK